MLLHSCLQQHLNQDISFPPRSVRLFTCAFHILWRFLPPRHLSVFFLLIFSPSSPAVSAVTNNSFEALNNLPLFITALEALSLAHSNGPGARCDPPMLDSSLWATFPLSVLMAFVSLSLSLTPAVCSQVIKISNLILNSLWINTTLDVLRDRSTALFFSLIHRKCEGAMFVIQQHFYRRFPSLLSCLHVF